MSHSLKRFPVQNGKTTFGLHMMLDAYGVPKATLDDMKLVYKYLYELPPLIGMKRLSSPVVVNAEESKSKFDPGGISGVVILAESHASIHTFAAKGFFTMDLYSCSDFSGDVDKVLKFTKKLFPFQTHQLQTVKRGLHYPVKNLNKK